jgi:hypothetical protein
MSDAADKKRRALAALANDFDLADKYSDMSDPKQATKFCIERTKYYESVGVERLKDDLSEFAAYVASLRLLLRYYYVDVIKDQEKLLAELESREHPVGHDCSSCNANRKRLADTVISAEPRPAWKQKHVHPLSQLGTSASDEPRESPSCHACGAIVGSFHAKDCTVMQDENRHIEARNALNNLLTRENAPVIAAVLAEVAHPTIDGDACSHEEGLIANAAHAIHEVLRLKAGAA